MRSSSGLSEGIEISDFNVKTCEVLLCTNAGCTAYVLYGGSQPALYTGIGGVYNGLSNLNDYTLVLNVNPVGGALTLAANTAYWYQVYASDFALTPAPIATDSVIGTFRTP